jgi:hypothetical protein
MDWFKMSHVPGATAVKTLAHAVIDNEVPTVHGGAAAEVLEVGLRPEGARLALHDLFVIVAISHGAAGRSLC